MQAWQRYTSSLLMPKRSLPNTKATRCAVALKLSNSARGACVGGPKSRGVIAVAQAKVMPSSASLRVSTTRALSRMSSAPLASEMASALRCTFG